MKLRELWPGLLLGAAFVFCLLMMTLKLAQSPASSAKRDGLTPETAVMAGDGTSDPINVAGRISLTRADLVWLPSLGAGRRCYLSLTIPVRSLTGTAYVTVPEGYCEGLH